MMATYDYFGWYSGESYPNRVADKEPSNKSTGETEGEFRSNWTGFAWVELPYVKPQEDKPLPASVEDYDKALVDYFDSVAHSDNWSDRVSLIARAGYPNKWQARAIAFGTWMDAANEQCLKMLDDFNKGLIAQPTVKELIDSITPMEWPK